MVFTFNQVSVRNPLQLESTKFHFYAGHSTEFTVGLTSKVISAAAHLEQPTANGTEQILISEKAKLQH